MYVNGSPVLCIEICFAFLVVFCCFLSDFKIPLRINQIYIMLQLAWRWYLFHRYHKYFENKRNMHKTNLRQWTSIFSNKNRKSGWCWHIKFAQFSNKPQTDDFNHYMCKYAWKTRDMEITSSRPTLGRYVHLYINKIHDNVYKTRQYTSHDKERTSYIGGRSLRYVRKWRIIYTE